jgi:hypothetical protein
MATMLDNYTTEEQFPLARFLRAKGLNTKDPPKEIFSVNGGKCLSHKAVQN